MKNRAVLFTQPGRLELAEQDLPQPAHGQVLVQARLSAISPGTEMLIYRGQFPTDLELDAHLPDLAGRFHYPVKYGYCLVGEVAQTGADVDPAWQGRRVFAFHPHESAFLAEVEQLIPIPQDIPDEQAVFLPNMETAVNLTMDGAPLLGERVAVFGQGIVGLLVTALLGRFPLAALLALDCYPLRRQAALDHGATACVDPLDPRWLEQCTDWLGVGADLVYELSGSPEALDQAIAVAGFDSRVMVGSWYGNKRHALNLGERFHRNRIRLVSSQVSSLAPALTGRWSKARRFGVAWEMLRNVQPASLITQRFPIASAEQAYQLIDQSAHQTIQVVLTYP